MSVYSIPYPPSSEVGYSSVCVYGNKNWSNKSDCATRVMQHGNLLSNKVTIANGMDEQLEANFAEHGGGRREMAGRVMR